MDRVSSLRAVDRLEPTPEAHSDQKRRRVSSRRSRRCLEVTSFNRPGAINRGQARPVG